MIIAGVGGARCTREEVPSRQVAEGFRLSCATFPSPASAVPTRAEGCETVYLYSHVARLEKWAVGAIQMPAVSVHEIRPGGCAEADRDVVHHILLQVL